MENREKVYQILVVNRTVGINSIIPDRYCYKNIEEALVDINRRKQAFEQAGEKFEYQGVIRGLGEVAKIYKDHDITVEGNEAYIYELDLKTKFDGQ